MNKDDIISEIKRTAKENGDKPLGRERFERSTGVKAYDVNRYWARWNDALIEAGFEPNSLNAAYDDSFLLSKLASLTIELGKFPTNTERRLKSFNDQSFPSPNTFDRLGNKHQLVTRLIAFCSSEEEYADAVEILRQIPVDPIDENVSGGEVTYGFVYLVKGHPGEYKIGRTNLVDRRLSELGATASIEQKLVHEIKTDDPAGIEAYWHRRFADKRMRGEWFKLSPDDVKTFKRWRRIY